LHPSDNGNENVKPGLPSGDSIPNFNLSSLISEYRLDSEREGEIRELDRNLTSEDAVFIRHYLRYADIFMSRVAESDESAKGPDKHKKTKKAA
jgi:hypothetical protein